MTGRENSLSDGERSLTPDFTAGADDETRPLPVPVQPTDLHAHIATAALAGHDHKPSSSLPKDGSPTSTRRSLRPRFSFTRHHDHPPHPPPFSRGVTSTSSHYANPADRFRSVVTRVIALRRTSHVLSTVAAAHAPGNEPGVDPRRANAERVYGHIRRRCVVDVVDYSPLRLAEVRIGEGSNEEIVRALEDERPGWAKVRWINVGGLSWDVVSELAIKHDMHPLALEDLLHTSATARSKADYYPNHLFLRVLCHSLGSSTSTSSSSDDTPDEDTNTPPPSKGLRSAIPSWSSRSRTLTGLPRSSSPGALDDDAKGDIEVEENELDAEAALFGFETGPPRSASLLSRTRKTAVAQLTLEQLKAADRVPVRLAPMCIYLSPDGTVLSFVPDTSPPSPLSASSHLTAVSPSAAAAVLAAANVATGGVVAADPAAETASALEALEFTAPILARLKMRDSTLRRTADPSLLVQSLLDIVVDRALEVVDEYDRRIKKLERDVLLHARVESVRALHILSGDLTLHKRTMDPIRSLVYGLRRYDADRYAAAAAVTANAQASDGNRSVQGKGGYMSPKSIIYLADVHDHIEYALASLDMYAALTENLIAYTFNMASYEMNQTMRSLTLVTIIFFPLTLLTGYFGMNFQGGFWSINNNSDLFFWELAIPLMAFLIPFFLWSDIVRAVQYCKKRLLARRIKKSVKKSTPRIRV